jgi:hypothetical protein
MARHNPDNPDADHRRRELDFMRELEEQSGVKQPRDEEAVVEATRDERVDEPPSTGEPEVR